MWLLIKLNVLLQSASLANSISLLESWGIISLFKSSSQASRNILLFADWIKKSEEWKICWAAGKFIDDIGIEQAKYS